VLQVIEVTPALPLVAWGQPVPEMQTEAFGLPRAGHYSFEAELDFASYRERPSSTRSTETAMEMAEMPTQEAAA
jgi:hypothetical protein